MRASLIFTVAIFMLGACSLNPQLNSDAAIVDKICNSQTFPSESAHLECQLNGMRNTFARDEPQTLPLFDRQTEQLRQIAQLKDQGKITSQQYLDLWNRIGDSFSNARNEAILTKNLDAFMHGAAVVMQATASAAPSQTQQTTCEVVLNQLVCKTVSY